MVALHPIRIGHLGVDDVAVSLRAGLVPAVRGLNEQGQLIAHELRFDLAENERCFVSFIVVTLK